MISEIKLAGVRSPQESGWDGELQNALFELTDELVQTDAAQAG